jgi:hypothetical protein
LTEITLPLNVSVKLPVSVEIGPTGAYSAIVDLIDPSVDLVAHSIMCTIIAPQPLPAPTYSATINASAPHPGNGVVFVNVPEGTSALHIRVTQKNGTSVALRAKMPDGRTPSTGPGDTSRWFLPSSDLKAFDQTFVDPPPGVWQFWMTHDGGLWPTAFDPAAPRPLKACDFTIRVTAEGLDSNATVAPTHGSGAEVTFTNRFDALKGARMVPVGIGAMREDAPVIRPGFSPVFYDLEIPKGTTKFEADVSSDRTAANLSLFLVRVPDDNVTPLEYQSYELGPGGHKHIELTSPPPGKYKICIDAWGGVPQEGLKLHYSDVIYHPIFGKVVVDDAARDLRVGEIRRANVQFQLDTPPTQGRKLVAQVGLFCEDCTALDPSAYTEALRKASETKWVTSDPSPAAVKPVSIATSTIVLPD